MAFNSWSSYGQFKSKIMHGQRYFYDQEAEQFLSEVLRTSFKRKKVIEKGEIYWRSQMGHDWRSEVWEGEETGEVPCPHSQKRMIPRRYLASEGRANPKGIPYLYLATNKETAMSELRPWKGSAISVGQFQIKKNLSIINCSLLHDKFIRYIPGPNSKEPDDDKKEEAVWSNIDESFSRPVTPSDDRADYVPTQIISEFFKNNGYDGVEYKSLLGTGCNIALFDIDSAEQINCFLYEAKEISIKFDEIDNPYFVSKSGSKEK